MSSSATSALLRIVSAIYEAGLDDSRWPDALDLISQATRDSVVMFQLYDASAEQGMIAHVAGPNVSWQQRYNDRFGAINPWFEAAKEQLCTGYIATGEDVLDNEELETTEFYREFLVPENLFHTINAIIYLEESISSNITLTRSSAAGPYDADDRALLRTLLPHLQRATRVHLQVKGAQSERALLEQVIERLPLGVAIVDAGGAMVAANRIAHTMLDAADCTAAQVVESCAAGNGAAAVPRNGVGRPLSAVASSRPRASQTILFISDPEAGPEAKADTLMRLYGLTAAESRLAAALAAGKSLPEAARLTGITHDTARTHLKRVFAKTQTRRQAELVRLLVASPAALLTD